MEYNSKIYLSPKYQKSDYSELNLSITSPEEDWKKAIEIFTDRMDGRFLNQIRALLSDVSANGFAIMALDCLLIETFLQFEIGKSQTPQFNSEQYSAFLMRAFPSAFKNINAAKRFYIDIRCGILHSAQTNGHSRLTSDESYIIYYDGDLLSVSVTKFSLLLVSYFEAYKSKLMDSNETNLRNNFLKKMASVCR